jgi:hypothetical protein
MENLICEFRKNLVLLRDHEIEKIKELDVELDKRLIMISSGKILELDHLISYVDEMLNYHNETNNITR